MIERPEIVTDEYLVFLDDLRDSGQTNMFAADDWLKVAFGLNHENANKILTYWMQSFGERHPK